MSKDIRICKVENCNKAARRNGYCERHAAQMKRHGKILETYKDVSYNTCRIKGCRGKLYSKDFCEKHYKQIVDYGELKEDQPKKICKVPWCNAVVNYNGYCNRHASQMKRNGKITKTYSDKPQRLCKVDGCDEPHSSNGYCSKHSMQMLNYEKIFERTNYDLNEYRFSNDSCYITLYDRNNNPKAEAIIDIEDYEKVKKYKWGVNASGYVTRSVVDSDNKEVYLSRFLLAPIMDNGIIVDHKNRDPLDNRKDNLRVATNSQNSANIGIQKNNSSGYKGVTWHRNKQKWTSSICKDGKKTYIGQFDSKDHAAMAYNCMAIKLFGEFGYLNDIVGV